MSWRWWAEFIGFSMLGLTVLSATGAGHLQIFTVFLASFLIAFGLEWNADGE